MKRREFFRRLGVATLGGIAALMVPKTVAAAPVRRSGMKYVADAAKSGGVRIRPLTGNAEIDAGIIEEGKRLTVNEVLVRKKFIVELLTRAHAA